MAKFVGYGIRAFLLDRQKWLQQHLVRPLLIFCLIWVIVAAVLLRLDLAVLDFLIHTKELSLIHGIVVDIPVTFATEEGNTIDAASLQEIHDNNTALLHGARNHMFFVLGCVFVLPIAIVGLLVWTPRGR